jgi:G3E family GTPase
MTKIDIISGFLGAGKTTFIKKMIDEAFTGEKIVLIENEFGEVGIDGGFFKGCWNPDYRDEFRMHLLFFSW